MGIEKELIPLGDRVLVEPVEEGDTKHGSIFIPDMGKEKPLTGKIVKKGPGRTTEFGHFLKTVDCAVGDVILLPKLSTIQVRFNQKTYYLIREKEILAIIKNNKHVED